MKPWLIAVAPPVVSIALAVPAHAGVPPTFQTPSGNILCWVAENTATCRTVDHTFALPPRGDCTEPGFGNSVWLDEGKEPFLPCDTEQPGAYHGMRSHVTLDYGRTKSAGVMSCESEDLGVTCIDSGTGHFFHVSRDALQLG